MDAAVDYEAVNSAAKRYADVVRKAMQVDKVVLFGSYARGTADEGSDVDLCFFLPSFDGRRRVDVIGELLKLTHNQEAFIEPIVFTTSEIERDNPFIKEVLRTGIEI